MSRPKTIAVDLDGTLYKQDGWTRGQIGNLLPDALDELKKFKADGWDIVIHTARIPEDFNQIELMLIKDGVPYTRFWRGKGKPLADVYLDDRGFTFTGKWDGVKEAIDAWNPWYGDKFLRPLKGSKDEDFIKGR